MSTPHEAARTIFAVCVAGVDATEAQYSTQDWVADSISKGQIP